MQRGTMLVDVDRRRIEGRRANADQRLSVGEMAEESMFLVTGLMVGGPTLPGLLFCVPGLLFFIVPAAILVIVPVLAMGLVAAVVGLVIVLAAAPVRVGRWAARRVRLAPAASSGMGTLTGR